ncbi:MAG: Jag N-terminal domain-containing protein [Candidatus Omnitrophica bacterium]|nr:Jag N-terminal domain-containing protein [Candidatus Omnitrophota bacterium]MDD5565735.1 Jag N-terminal domain-containing protein [Candidatus Omnitrophota bacterium]
MHKQKISIEVEGKTVEEAIQKALDKLKLKRNQVKVEVLSEEEKGLFGMAGAKPAKVKVSLLSKQEIS